MHIKTSLPWLTRAFAIIGVIALITAVVLGFSRDNDAVTSSYADYGGGVTAMRSESASFDQSFATSSPELLKDGNPNVEQKVIRTGSLSLVVDDAVESALTIRALAEAKKGFVETSSIVEQEDGTHYGYVNLRVPSTTFEASMAELKKMAVIVESEGVSSQDVTEQYIDLSARLNNAKAQEIRYVEILKTAKTVEEMLQIEQALASVRATIESFTGQMQYLESQTDMSAISVTLSEEPAITIGGKVFRPWTNVKQAAQAVVSLAQQIVIAIIWVVIVGVGIGLPVAIIGWVGWKSVRRFKRK